jgi:hypothetical protein
LEGKEDEKWERYASYAGVDDGDGIRQLQDKVATNIRARVEERGDGYMVLKNAVPARTNIRPGLDVTPWMICKTLRAYAGHSNGVVGYACINYESIYACCSRHYAKLYSTTKLP